MDIKVWYQDKRIPELIQSKLYDLGVEVIDDFKYINKNNLLDIGCNHVQISKIEELQNNIDVKNPIISNKSVWSLNYGNKKSLIAFAEVHKLLSTFPGDECETM